MTVLRLRRTGTWVDMSGRGVTSDTTGLFDRVVGLDRTVSVSPAVVVPVITRS